MSYKWTTIKSNELASKVIRVGDTIKLTNGDIVTVTEKSRKHASCSITCYFGDGNKCICSNGAIDKELIPDFYKYIWLTKNKICFLKYGWYFKRINREGGV